MKILPVTLLVEGALAGIYIVVYFFGRALPLEPPTFKDLIVGVTFSVALLGFNLVLFRWVTRRIRLLSELSLFRTEVIDPLVRMIAVGQIPLIALLAGVGEELFFRGVLLPYTGVVISSLLFAFLHFGSAVGRFPLTAVFYALIGVCFALIAQRCSLGAAIISHALYDALILIILKRERRVTKDA